MDTFVTSTNVSKMTFSDETNGIGDITISSANGSLLGVTGMDKKELRCSFRQINIKSTCSSVKIIEFVKL